MADRHHIPDPSRRHVLMGGTAAIAAAASPAPALARPATLPLAEALSLHKALRTVTAVMDGFLCQPRFESAAGDLNSAGRELARIVSALDQRADELTGLIATLTPTNVWDAEERISHLASHYIEAGEAQGARLVSAISPLIDA